MSRASPYPEKRHAGLVSLCGPVSREVPRSTHVAVPAPYPAKRYADTCRCAGPSPRSATQHACPCGSPYPEKRHAGHVSLCGPVSRSKALAESPSPHNDGPPIRKPSPVQEGALHGPLIPRQVTQVTNPLAAHAPSADTSANSRANPQLHTQRDEAPSHTLAVAKRHLSQRRTPSHETPTCPKPSIPNRRKRISNTSERSEAHWPDAGGPGVIPRDKMTRRPWGSAQRRDHTSPYSEWSYGDSNPRPPPCHGGALPTAP